MILTRTNLRSILPVITIVSALLVISALVFRPAKAEAASIWYGSSFGWYYGKHKVNTSIRNNGSTTLRGYTLYTTRFRGYAPELSYTTALGPLYPGVTTKAPTVYFPAST